MKFERESWRKLYIAESAEHRLLSVFTRGLRDYLLRLASDDGTLLSATKNPKKDLVRLLNAQPKEKAQIENGYDDLMRIRYLSLDGERLWIRRFEDAQSARSPGAVRQARFKENERQRKASANTSPPTLPGDVTGNGQGDAGETLQIDETRRDETRTPKPPVVVTLPERARKILANPHDGQFAQPSTWPEVLAICEAWSFGMRIKLRDFVNSDSDLRAILEAIAAEEFTVEQLVVAGELAKKSEYFAKLDKPGPASFTPAVLRRLLGGAVAKPVGADETGGYGPRSEWVL